MAQKSSRGPVWQWPSFVESVSAPSTAQSPAPPSHWLEAVCVPGMVQALPGQTELGPNAGHGAPALAPPWHRLPPQIAPGSGQSAAVKHGSAAASSHVSQKHLLPAKPGALQFGLDAVSVRVWLLVESVKPEGMRLPNMPPLDGGQSKLT